MLDLGEGSVEMMEQLLPLLIVGRFAQADCVIFECFPFHQQDVSVALLDAATDLVGAVALHSGDDG